MKNLSLLHSRYLPQHVLGTGTYGQVLQCMDTVSGEKVAVKVTHRDPAYRRSALSEIRALHLLSHSDDVVRLLDSFENSGHVCIVSELLHRNFYEVLTARGFKPLSLDALRKVSEHVLRALSELHKVGYMHCDIKPENVMLRRSANFDECSDDDFDSTCLIDFGAVRQFHENTYYDVQSLWYRAPEVLLGVPYTSLIDSWSVGCLLFELYTGKPLFPCENPPKQFASIVHTVGMPSLEAMTMGVNVAKLQLPFLGREVGNEMELRRHIMKCRGTSAMYQCSPPNEEVAFVNMLCHLLQPDPSRRLTCTDAVFHPFFGQSKTFCEVRSNSFQSHSGTMMCDSLYSGGLSPAASDAQSFNCFEQIMQQSQSSPIIAGNCNTLPMTLVGNSGGVIVSTPTSSQQATTVLNMSSSQLFVGHVVYPTPQTTVVQQVPFSIQTHQPTPQQTQAQPPLPPPPPQPQQQHHHPHQHQALLYPYQNQSQQNCVNALHTLSGCCQQSTLQAIPDAHIIPHPTHPHVLPVQAFHKQHFPFASVTRQNGGHNVLAFGLPLGNPPQAVVYAPS